MRATRLSPRQMGRWLWRRVDRESPLAILLDMKMPVMDGWEFVKQYRERVAAAAPIIVMTAAHDPRVRAAQVHAFDVLAKPFELIDLLAVVARALRRAAA
jgi:DNA-binding response OmpR family regulator